MTKWLLNIMTLLSKKFLKYKYNDLEGEVSGE